MLFQLTTENTNKLTNKTERTSVVHVLHDFFKCKKKFKKAVKTPKSSHVSLNIKETMSRGKPFGKEGCSLFIGNLAPDVKEDDISAVFAQCGQIVDIRLKRNPENGNVKGILEILQIIN